MHLSSPLERTAKKAYEELGKPRVHQILDIAKRNGNAKENLSWFAEFFFMWIILCLFENEMCWSKFLFTHFLFSSVKFPPSHDYVFGHDAKAAVAKKFLIQLHSKPRKWSSLSLRSPDIVTEWDLEFGSELSLDSSPTLDLNESIDINSDIRILHYSTHTGTTRNLEWIRLSQITGLFGKFPPEFLDRAMRYFDDLRWQASSFILSILFSHGDLNQVDSSLVLGMVRRSITLTDLQSKAGHSKSARLSTSYLPC